MRATLLLNRCHQAFIIKCLWCRKSHTQCTSAPQSEWMDQAQFQQGWKSKVIKLTSLSHRRSVL